MILASGADLLVQLDLEERLQSGIREAASRRIEELQSTAGSRARVSIGIGAIKDMVTEEARRLRADERLSPEQSVAARGSIPC